MYITSCTPNPQPVNWKSTAAQPSHIDPSLWASYKSLSATSQKKRLLRFEIPVDQSRAPTSSGTAIASHLQQVFAQGFTTFTRAWHRASSQPRAH